MTYYLILIHRFVGPDLAKYNGSCKILAYRDLEKAKDKAKEISASGDYRFLGISILTVTDLDSENKDTKQYYKFVD